MADALNCCAGCRNKISNKHFLSCAFCKLKYDLTCANLTDKRFLTMGIDQKNKWKCHGCRAKQPKMDNTNTPVRPNDSPIKSRDSIDSHPDNINVTYRKKFQADDSIINEYSSLDQQQSLITKDDVRAIIREELTSMRQALSQELHQTLKQLVRNELQSIKEEVIALESSVEFLNENYENNKSDIAKYQESLSKLQKENTQLNNCVHDLQIRLHVMEQHNRSNNIELQCVPEHRHENLLSIVTQLSKVVSCEIKESDIHHCTRVAKTNKDDKRPRSIIVKFATPRIRDNLLAKTINYNKANPKDKINTSHLGIGGNKTPIYVIEHLSPMNKKLHAAARQVAKEKDFKFVWVKQGRVFLRKAEDSEFIFIKNQETLDRIKQT